MRQPSRTALDSVLHRLLNKWHAALSLPRQSPPSWYRARLLEELRELRSASTTLSRLSETADVFFSISRARYDGFPVRTLPPFSLARHGVPMVYMVAKFTLRWGFYRTAARLCGAKDWKSVREVINPLKDRKLGEVSARHGIDPDKFRNTGRMLRRVWPLLP
ncbi:hypothetical protein SMACR_08922 [Sordaria macrospora]|uniref:WGS project CABT00000000 data, contig 2.69 n=2 Tax=Sordaria macrospora TaxID=5147 RepID=F7WB43_SORMK|nr:uncharacterized protein SMAC_08922 [Sordaria macrospora k-hell]KAA8628599.1 hypothetical protein SMACR_08922 [Sordaria macrospora]KAH7635544.1 hypothetical protein B0T09DRAFT_353990 [Sordaria sp. MPI-SDFR-AT-0083]WPJ64026.1 hypothetical protein SMAC4_08922 [Sordaria macrospora]CCC14335.1 unnamed protein product [Sordaria macrospora k-hell]